jgi:hypothetical protein
MKVIETTVAGYGVFSCVRAVTVIGVLEVGRRLTSKPCRREYHCLFVVGS